MSSLGSLPLQAGREAALEAAVKDWRAAPAHSSTEAEWREEGAHAHQVGCACGWREPGPGCRQATWAQHTEFVVPPHLPAAKPPLQVLGCFIINSRPHRAMRLWCALCEAAAKDAASPSGHGAPLLPSLLPSAPAPLVWQPDMALAAALVGACQDEFEVGMPVVVAGRPGGGTSILVEEIKLGAKGAHTCLYLLPVRSCLPVPLMSAAAWRHPLFLHAPLAPCSRHLPRLMLHALWLPPVQAWAAPGSSCGASCSSWPGCMLCWASRSPSSPAAWWCRKRSGGKRSSGWHGPCRRSCLCRRAAAQRT